MSDHERGLDGGRSAGATSQGAGAAANAPSDLRTALRQRTTELHRRLDRLPEQRALLAPGLTIKRYVAIMTRHRRALAACETELAALAGARPDGLAPYRTRLPALDTDLARLAAPRPRGPATARVPRSGAAAAPNVDSERARGTDPAPAKRLGRYLGTRYVLEGSTQGAIAIARCLTRHLPELRTGAFRYWRVQTDEAPGWHALAAMLAALPGRGPTAEAAVQAACDAFCVFLAAFASDDAVEALP